MSCPLSERINETQATGDTGSRRSIDGLDAEAVTQLDVLGRAHAPHATADGARSARSITFLAVCSAEMNSITSTR